MIRINGGSFNRNDGISITLNSFSISPFELTKEEWDSVRTFTLDRGYDLAEGSGTGREPVGNITWYDAVKFCNAMSEIAGLTPVYYQESLQKNIYRSGRLDIDNTCVKWDAEGYRLPTEAEWEYACRAGTDTKFYWGNESIPGEQNEYAWHFNGFAKSFYTREIGLKKPNSYGLYDMSGNAGEWCWDWYSYEYNADDTDNPKGAESGLWRVLRGGSVALDSIVESGFRSFTYPAYNLYETGVRLASSNVNAPSAAQILDNVGKDGDAITQKTTKVNSSAIRYLSCEVSDITKRMIEVLDPESEIYAVMKNYSERNDFNGALVAYRDYFISNYKFDFKEELYFRLTHEMRDRLMSTGSEICWFAEKEDLNFIEGFQELRTLLYAWLKDRNRACLEKWLLIMKDYAINHKRKYDMLKSEELDRVVTSTQVSWRWNNGFEAPCRMRGIFYGLSVIIDSLKEDERELIPADVLSLLVLSVVTEHMPTAIKDARSIVPNQILNNGKTLIIAGYILKEFKDADEWLKLGLKRFTTALSERSMLFDGGDLEQTFVYNYLLIHEVFELSKLVSGKKPEWIKDIEALSLKRARMFISLTQPVGGLPALGSCQSYYPPDITKGGEALSNYKDFQYKEYMEELKKSPCIESRKIIETLWGDKKDAEPSFTSIGLPFSGYYALRDRWDTMSRYLSFIASRRGTGHACENINSVDLIAFGRHMLVEAGACSYGIKSAVPEDQLGYMKQIDNYRKKSFGHNTVVVDGNSQRRLIYGENADVMKYKDTIGTRWLTSERFDYCEGSYDDGYGNEKDEYLSAKHIRRVIFVKEAGIYIINDSMIADEPHRYTQLWGFPPERFTVNSDEYKHTCYSNEYKYTWESIGFAANEIHVDSIEKTIWTAQKSMPNVFLYHFTSKELQYEQYYGQLSPAYGWMAPNLNGRRIPKPDVHASWNGDAGTSCLVTVIAPAQNEFSPVKSKKCLTDDKISGCRMELEDETIVTYMSAIEKDELSIDNIKAVAQQLLVVNGKRGRISGIVLGCESIIAEKHKIEIPYADFEFEVVSGKMEIVRKIIIPASFEWVEYEDGVKPVYKE